MWLFNKRCPYPGCTPLLVDHNSPRYVSTWLVLLCLVVSLWSCGFHLRGATKLSPEIARIHISGLSPYSDVAVVLRQQLRANGVEIVEVNQSTATLRITHNGIGKRVLSVGSDGKVREYELFAKLSFEVRDVDKTVLLQNQTITLTRDFIFDPNDVLGKAEEEALLKEDLHENLIRLLIYRLQAI